MGLRDAISSSDSTSIVPSSEENNGEDRDSGDSGVVVGEYTWDDYVREYAPEEGDYNDIPSKHKHEDLREGGVEKVASAKNRGEKLQDVFEDRTVQVSEELDEDEFFSNVDGDPTITTRYDLEKAVDQQKKYHFEEIDRYWVNKPFAFVILFKSSKENEVKYFVIEPYLNAEEEQVLDFLKEKLQDTIKFNEEAVKGERTNAERAALIERETYKLINRFELAETLPYEEEATEDDESTNDGGGSFLTKIPGINSKDSSNEDESDEQPNADEDVSEDSTDSGSGEDDDGPGFFSRLLSRGGGKESKTIAQKLIEHQQQNKEVIGESTGPIHVFHQAEDFGKLAGSGVRPEAAVMNEGAHKLTPYQIAKLLYYLKRDSVSYGKIDPIKHDIAVEDISCDGYDSRVFVYHEEYEQIISNVMHGRETLDDFVVNLAQRSGKGISKRQPQVDATLPDGSRAQLTLGTEVSDHGTNYTIRQFQEIPHTPIDLINWKTFSPEQMAFLWLAIENNKSLVFAGGTASGKTTSLNAVSLFIPSNAKIVSIEDTREVELPQRNWVASVTRPSFTQDGAGDIDEFALLEAALRQRPDYIVMGEIRGEEGRTLFQVMSTGHTTYTTFHADTVGEVIKRFTTEPINVSKTLFTALDLISIQTQTRVEGHKVRRNKILTEVNEYSAETDEINVNDVFEWDAQEDTYERSENSQVLERIKFDRGWHQERLDRETTKREVVIAYLIKKRLNTYTQVAATVQAFMNEADVILNLIAQEKLEDSLESLREMESVVIDIDQEKEDMVPRPDPTDETLAWANEVLNEARSDGGVLDGRESEPLGSLSQALSGLAGESDTVAVDDETDTPIPDVDDIVVSGDGSEDIEDVYEAFSQEGSDEIGDIEEETEQTTVTDENTDDFDFSETDDDSEEFDEEDRVYATEDENEDEEDDDDGDGGDDDFSGFVVGDTG